MTTDEQVRERVRRVLGAIGDAALPATAFDEIDPAGTEPWAAESTFRRRAAVTVALATAVMVAVAGIVLLRNDSDTVQTATPPTADVERSVGPDSTSVVTTSTVAVIETSDAARRAATAATGIADPWYYVDLDDARPAAAGYMVAGTIPGFSTSVWVTDDGSYDRLIVIHAFPATEFATTLTGTDRAEVTNPMNGRGFLVWDDADPVVGNGFRGNEFRWERDDGMVWELRAFGVSATEVVKNALIAMDATDLAAPQSANLPGFELVGTTDGNETLAGQTITLGDATMQLTRNDGPPITTDGFAGAAAWTAVSRRDVAGRDAVVAVVGDTANAIWETAAGQSFTLGGIPIARLGEVLDAVTWLDRAGEASPPPSASTSATPTVTTAPDPEVEDLVRPVIDTSYCTPLSAGEWTETEHNLFARSRAGHPTVQIIGDPSADITAPYAVVERFFTDQRPPNMGEIHDINGREGRVYIGKSGSGQVAWLLPDGTEAYIRSRGWGADELLQLARALSPRTADAAVPGFDVTGALPAGAALIGETAGPLIGSGARSMCQLDGNGGHLNLAVIRGDIPYTFGVNVDWSPLPTVIQRGDAVVGIAGPPHTPARAIDDVTNATPEEWEALLQAAEPLPAPPPDAPTTTDAT